MILKIGSEGTEVEKLQRGLNAHGAKLKVDGDFGKATEIAVKAFQHEAGIKVDGIVGPLTQMALSHPDATAPEKETEGDPKWIQIAKAEIGVKEISGSGNNPRILEYHDATTLSANQDAVAWCSAFVCWCLEKAGIKPNRNAWAQSQATFGKKLNTPQLGCLVVFRWNADSGHVGFFMGWNSNGTMKILGGNQSDAVCYSNFGTGSVLAYRWPQ